VPVSLRFAAREKNGQTGRRDQSARRRKKEREKTGTGECKKKFTIDLRSTIGPVPCVCARMCGATAAFSLEQRDSLHLRVQRSAVKGQAGFPFAEALPVGCHLACLRLARRRRRRSLRPRRRRCGCRRRRRCPLSPRHRRRCNARRVRRSAVRYRAPLFHSTPVVSNHPAATLRHRHPRRRSPLA